MTKTLVNSEINPSPHNASNMVENHFPLSFPFPTTAQHGMVQLNPWVPARSVGRRTMGLRQRQSLASYKWMGSTPGNEETGHITRPLTTPHVTSPHLRRTAGESQTYLACQASVVREWTGEAASSSAATLVVRMGGACRRA
jgi:hypothetical protein